jgi:thymidylate kinase
LQIKTIAFEGLDGSGKGTSIRELSELIECECWETPDRIKQARREKINEQGGETDELQEFMVESFLDEWSEIERLCSRIPRGRVVLIDRCWVSTSAVRSARTGLRPTWPAAFRPDVIFTIRVDEDLRSERIISRAGGIDGLNSRERELIENEEFREGVLRAELEMGCIPLRIRERSPSVVAMRALQNLLGRKGFTYLPR